MFYVTVAALYPSDRETVRLYDDFDAAISFGDIVVDTENYRDALRYYAEELKNPNVSEGGIFCSCPARPACPGSMAEWAAKRVEKLSEDIVATGRAIECLGQWLLHGFYDDTGKLESHNINGGRALGDCINMNEKNRAEIQRLRRKFEV